MNSTLYENSYQGYVYQGRDGKWYDNPISASIPSAPKPIVVDPIAQQDFEENKRKETEAFNREWSKSNGTMLLIGFLVFTAGAALLIVALVLGSGLLPTPHNKQVAISVISPIGGVMILLSIGICLCAKAAGST